MSETLLMLTIIFCYLLIVLLLGIAYNYFKQDDFNDDFSPVVIICFPITIPILLVIFVFTLIFDVSSKIATKLKG